MKSAGHVAKLTAGRCSVELPDPIVHILRLVPRSELYATVLIPNDISSSSIPRPIGTLLASPYPISAWPRLVRASFTVPTGPGRIHRFMKAMGKVSLYPRSLEAEEGVDLSHTHPWGASQKQDPKTERYIVPAIFTVLEVPMARYSNRSETARQHQVSEENWVLHEALHALFEQTPDSDALRGAFEAFKDRLKELKEEFGVTIDWLSPMKAMNETYKYWGEELHSRRKRILVDSDKPRSISLSPWRDLIWPTAKESVEDAFLEPVGHDRAIVLSADSDEKLLIGQLYDLDKTAIATFDVAAPTGGLEQEWWRWILAEIEDANGNLLGCGNTARVLGRWASLRLTVAFRACMGASPTKCSNCSKRDNANEAVARCKADIGHLIRCFRYLKGESATDEHNKSGEQYDTSKLFSHLKDTLKNKKDDSVPNKVEAHCIGVDESDSSAKPNRARVVATDSTLGNVIGWYHRGDRPTDIDYQNRFGRNLFNLTNPLDLEAYNSLYRVQELEDVDSRLHLAKRIQACLCSVVPEHVALVGTARTGKTSVMRMVTDLINDESTGSADTDANEQDEKQAWIAVTIDAATTHPGELLASILVELDRLKETTTKERVRNLLKTAIKEGRELFMKAVSKELELGWQVKIPGVPGKFNVRLSPPKGKRKKAKTGRDDIERSMAAVIAKMKTDGERYNIDRRAAFLRLCIECLSQALKDANVGIVVAMDEIGASLQWGGEWAVPTWRHIMENKDLANVRWLFSSPVPLSKTSKYSPLGNALREYNLQPLRQAEAEAMLRAFEWPPNKESTWPAAVEEADRLRPTVTFGAQHMIMWATARMPYLMQVTCCHLFEQSIREHVPVITEEVAEDIIQSRVIPELTDYFDMQWRKLPKPHRKSIERLVRSEPGILREHRHGRGDLGAQPDPVLLRAIERAGLGDARGKCLISPLLLEWLRTGRATA